jgi:transcription antitermination factor NusG
MENRKYFWYALYTKFNSEKKVSRMLTEMNVEHYLPLRKVVRQWCDREKMVEEPLFKSYVFVRVSQLEFFEVLNLSGAHSFVSFGGKAKPIPEEQILEIKELIEKCPHELELPYDDIQEGKKVEVLSGPMKGYKGEVAEVDGRDRIIIRVKTIGCCIHSHIRRDEIRVL